MADAAEGEAASEEVSEGEAASEEARDDVLSGNVSHFRNAEAHSSLVRYGIPLWILLTLGLLLNADIGSEVAAKYILRTDETIEKVGTLLEVSIFSSVKELWKNETYALAILIAVTSIAWPYLKLLLTVYAWFVPYRTPRRREALVECLDAFGKWSFVDIFVLVEVMVAFRQTVVVVKGAAYVEIVVQPMWGFYAFVVATMMSLISAHVVLYHHRKLHCHERSLDGKAAEEEEEKDTVNDVGTEPSSEPFLTDRWATRALGASVSIVACALYLTGCIVPSFDVYNETAGSEVTEYSIVSIAPGIRDSIFQMEEGEIEGSSFGDNFGNRFIQVMWYLLGIASPLLCTLLFGSLYIFPSTPRATARKVFTAAEIAFAWGCGEVMLVSTVFSVWQIPVFGDGLIEGGCNDCSVVDTNILPVGMALLCAGTVVNITANVFMYRKAHSILYHSH